MPCFVLHLLYKFNLIHVFLLQCSPHFFFILIGFNFNVYLLLLQKLIHAPLVLFEILNLVIIWWCAKDCLFRFKNDLRGIFVWLYAVNFECPVLHSIPCSYISWVLPLDPRIFVAHPAKVAYFSLSFNLASLQNNSNIYVTCGKLLQLTF